MGRTECSSGVAIRYEMELSAEARREQAHANSVSQYLSDEQSVNAHLSSHPAAV
jgi:hypothetical protein